MHLTILHYHLRPGGVTTVIRNAQRALEDRFDIQLLTGFGYNERPARSRLAFLRESSAFARRLSAVTGRTEVLHTHNLNLGKHPRLACAVKMLAEQGRIRFINQVHDFAEDNRPAQWRALRYCTGSRNDSFWRSFCYYDLPNVLWTTLTSHDAVKLAQRGVPQGRIHVLPNPVDDRLFTRPVLSRQKKEEALLRIGQFARAHSYSFDPRRKILLSPMKVMRRKNNAEALELVTRLNALGGRDEFQLIISLDASSLGDRAYSDQLKRKIRRERLPVVIGVGAIVDALSQFQLAQAILTTSKVEGFGYAFMEGWLCGKLVLGRDIPEVTFDFVAEGMDLDHFYHELDDRALCQIDRLLARPPRRLIELNREVVLRKYSMKAYARRFEGMLKQFGPPN
jgi:glycosyltransferase involved in cell wall biosynthesis